MISYLYLFDSIYEYIKKILVQCQMDKLNEWVNL